jgi:hypothetical protein
MPVKTMMTPTFAATLLVLAALLVPAIRRRRFDAIGAFLLLYWVWLSVNPVRLDKADALRAVPPRWRPATRVLRAPPGADTPIPPPSR